MLNLCEDRYSLGIGVVVMNSAVKVLTACGQAGDVNVPINYQAVRPGIRRRLPNVWMGHALLGHTCFSL